MLVIFSGCASSNTDVRQEMLEAALKTDKEFPNGRKEVLTQFAYLGTVNTKDGIIRVVFCRSVITDMPALRGESRIYFFNAQNVLIGKLGYSTLGTPLLCDGSKLYFFGIQNNGKSVGNALELRNGLANAQFIYAERIGSWTHS